jgi:hypothetical protein
MPAGRPRPTIGAVPNTMQTRVLETAAVIAGGIPQLCKRLDASEEEMRQWLADESTCPLEKFLQAVDVILESDRGFSAVFRSKPPENGGPAK